MLNDVHHVSMYGMDLAGVQLFMERHFGIVPIKFEGIDEGEPSGARKPAAALLKPKVAMFPIGKSLLEFMQPRARLSRQYDVVRRNGGEPTVSHICWRLEGISDRLDELMSRGADMLEKGFAGVSPHGGYYVMNIFAEEAVRGIWFQLAEDLSTDEVKAIETGEAKAKTHVKEVATSDHRWLASTNGGGMLTHVHHACYQLWGLEYILDYMDKVFGVKPFKREDLPTEGVRSASFRFGRTIAQFEEPTTFGHPGADFALGFSTHSGFGGGGVSDVGWAVEDLDKRVRELRKDGVKFIQDNPVASPHGGYRLIDTSPELAGGLKFQLCEDL
jgi:methylmalonyl-CoA/ethylmalonyl-CoA epimerase